MPLLLVTHCVQIPKIQWYPPPPWSLQLSLGSDQRIMTLELWWVLQWNHLGGFENIHSTLTLKLPGVSYQNTDRGNCDKNKKKTMKAPKWWQIQLHWSFIRNLSDITKEVSVQLQPVSIYWYILIHNMVEDYTCLRALKIWVQPCSRTH